MRTKSPKKKAERVSFSKIPQLLTAPDLLEVQLRSYREFLQDDVPAERRKRKGLEEVLRNSFPITDTKELYLLEYVSYTIDKPRYTIEECIERGLTYEVSLKAKLRLSYKDEPEETEWKETQEQEVYLGKIPYMTERGTFIINGAERVIVAQLHRSPGVVFSDATHPNGKKMYSAKIVPLRGSWIEFQTDINNLLYVYIDQKKKFLATTLLRAVGFPRSEDILRAFDMLEEVSVFKDPEKNEHLIGRYLADDVINQKTDEVISSGVIIGESEIEQLIDAGVTKVKVNRLDKETDLDKSVVVTTLTKDESRTEEQALETIYRELRSNEAPDLEAARGLLDRTFFNSKKYDLGDVGRYRLNKKLSDQYKEIQEIFGKDAHLKRLFAPIEEKIGNLKQPDGKVSVNPEQVVLTQYDMIAIMYYMLRLVNGKIDVDDVDHLSNRRVKSVGEQLSAQFLVGLARMAKNVKEKLNARDSEKVTPSDLVNARTVSSVISSFFGTSQLSQFMDQTNPLAELTNKRRTSALGPGGLTRERAGFEVRDVHYTHYGRLCPIETPEGPNIGLISSFCIYAKINEKGFIETPYRPVKEGVPQQKVEYLSAEDEENKITVPATVKLDNGGKISGENVQARRRGDYPLVSPKEVQFMDVAPNQIVSAAAALIPFLEHDDANRALMGSNMQRQAVPLLRAEAPLVGTGLEATIARDSRTMISAEGDGVIESVTSNEIVVRYDKRVDDEAEGSLIDVDETLKSYKLTKFFRSNQDTVINQKPIVSEGQRVKKGEVLADGSSTENGELALGKNVLVAFMPWRGYNFEDAIVLSERLVSDDVYTSIHIHEFELTVRDTKRGEEQFTRDIYNVSEDALKNLDENGIIRIGAEVKEKDILIGKITPKGETDPTPEEKLLRAIFGEKSSDVKDASLHAPPGMNGVVIKTKLFSRKKKLGEDPKLRIAKLEKEYTRKKEELLEKFFSRFMHYLDGKESVGVREKDEIKIRKGTTFTKQNLEVYRQITRLDRLDLDNGFVESKKTNNIIRRLVDEYRRRYKELDDELENERYKLNVGDELQPGIEELAKVYIAQKRKLQVGDKMAGRHGNKGVVGKIVPMEDMPFMEDGTPVDIVLNPLGVPSRMNIGQLFETSLGWAAEKLGVKFATPIFDGASYQEVQEKLKEAGLPVDGKVQLYDGRTGEAFDQKVTVGQIYMLKLSHLVDDKIHARSTGPYSLITQQPLGGKAQFGGQRFGEMEVWALEAYGAAHILQEILTVKSDDVNGRTKTYEAIVKGQNLPEPNVPESFNVLVRELQGLGLEIRIDDRVP
ncbi:MAG: DNA-directed RNA polymerase subunit beta [Chloroherpetonaceae bacterium]|nr:DNA-directed RNA polymerase subunit beta [Chloroherpetonaceae bacterium]